MAPVVGPVRSLALLGEADPKDAAALAAALAAVAPHLRAMLKSAENADAAAAADASAWCGGVARAATAHLAGASAAKSPHVGGLVSAAADALRVLERLDDDEDDEEEAQQQRQQQQEQERRTKGSRSRRPKAAAATPGQPREADMLRYALIRRLVGCRLLPDALAQGWRLLERLSAALGEEGQEEGGAAPPEAADPPVSPALADLFTGAVLSLVVCAAEVGGGPAPPASSSSPSALALQRAVAASFG